MKRYFWLVLALLFLLFACQSATAPVVTIVEDNRIVTLQTNERVPATLLNATGTTLNPNDGVLLNGLPVEPNHPITNHSITLQLRRAVNITIVTPDGEQK